MGRVALLALTASLNPTLLAATTVMLLLERPRRLMLGYLCGAYLTSITVGLVIVLSLPNSGAVATTQKTISPAADVALGAVVLAASIVLRGGRRERLAVRVNARRAGKGEKQPPRWRRELRKGTARTTFVLGVILTLPGASYLVALHEIHVLELSTATTVLLVVGFNVVMLWL